MDSLIRSQKGRAVCVCILPELTRRNIVDTKQKMIAFMNGDHIVFASYDEEKELTNLDTGCLIPTFVALSILFAAWVALC